MVRRSTARMAASLSSEAQARGISQARDEAMLISHTAVEPPLTAVR